MKKIECDRCGKIHEPSESETIELNKYSCEIEICPECWDLFKKWIKI